MLNFNNLQRYDLICQKNSPIGHIKFFSRRFNVLRMYMMKSGTYSYIKTYFIIFIPILSKAKVNDLKSKSYKGKPLNLTDIL